MLLVDYFFAVRRNRMFKSFERNLKLVLLLSQLVWLSACTNLPYYAQAVNGHWELMRRSQSIDTVLADPATEPKLRHALGKVTEIRNFASQELKLPDNSSYTRYADLQRPYVVWNVFAAPELSLKLKEWCFLQVGCVKYRGFFSQTDAERYAAELRQQGFDVHVGGISAYSTLGWFSDPVLNTFIDYSEMNLARLIFHELAHQVVYVQDDTTFNESFAAAVELEGVRRWFERRGTVFEQATLRNRQEREAAFAALVFKYRKELQILFQSEMGELEKRAGKQRILEALREEYQHLKTDKPDFAVYDAWFAQPLNNAVLATVSIYTQLLPAFQAILRQHDHDMERFFSAVNELSQLNKMERGLRLQQAAEAQKQWMSAER